MRRYLILPVLVICLSIAAGLATLAEDQAVKMFVNGCQRKFDPPALVRDGKTYVPLRAGANSLGASVKWDDKTQSALITSGTRKTTIRKAQGIIVDGRLLIPLRLMAETLNCNVKWDASAKAVRITTAASRSGST